MLITIVDSSSSLLFTVYHRQYKGEWLWWISWHKFRRLLKCCWSTCT